jgi:molecular chaperone GrpE
MVEVNEEKMEMLRAEIEEQKEKYLRLVAEFDNFRKRSRKEHYELEQTAGKDVIVSLLVVLDDMDRAARQLDTTEDVSVIKEGVSLVFNKLRSAMQKRGLVAMEAQGAAFDPDIHEAITEIPVPDPTMQGKIIDVIEPGYYLNEKLIRCAKVVIGSSTDTSL